VLRTAIAFPRRFAGALATGRHGTQSRHSLEQAHAPPMAQKQRFAAGHQVGE
jgi:hypothetical protein